MNNKESPSFWNNYKNKLGNYLWKGALIGTACGLAVKRPKLGFWLGCGISFGLCHNMIENKVKDYMGKMKLPPIDDKAQKNI